MKCIAEDLFWFVYLYKLLYYSSTQYLNSIFNIRYLFPFQSGTGENLDDEVQIHFLHQIFHVPTAQENECYYSLGGNSSHQNKLLTPSSQTLQYLYMHALKRCRHYKGEINPPVIWIVLCECQSVFISYIGTEDTSVQRWWCPVWARGQLRVSAVWAHSEQTQVKVSNAEGQKKKKKKDKKGKKKEGV